MLAIISGGTGQDASYLSEYLLDNGWEVLSFSRRVSTPTDERIRHLFNNSKFKYIEGDITDASFIANLLNEYKPDHFYSLAAMSHVANSFETTSNTFEINTIGVLNILNAIRNFSRNTKMYQASTSEMFGSSYTEVDGKKFQNENTPFQSNSPYAISKKAAHELVDLYRRSYNLFCCSGILFNHESPRRGEKFVTKKITKYISNLKKNQNIGKLKLGNIDASRDWGHAKDYVKAMYLMLMNNKPVDYVIATGETHTVREFLEIAFGYVGLDWREYVEIDKTLFRPCEVPYLCGDSNKARKELGWEPQYSFDDLVKEMLNEDLGGLL